MLKNVTEAFTAYVHELKETEKNLVTLKHIKGFTGFRRNGINVIGSRPFIGLTEFLLSIAIEFAGLGKKTMFVATHQSSIEIIRTLVAMINGIAFNELTGTMLSETKLEGEEANNLFIYEATVDKRLTITSNLSPLVIGHDIDHLIIDRGKVDMHALSEMLELREVTVYLGQTLGKSADKHIWPSFKDFIKCGVDMRATHVAVGLTRPEMYNVVIDEDGEGTRGIAEIVIVKSPFEEVNTRHRVLQDEHFRLPEWSAD